MEKEVLIKVEGVSKKFAKDLKKSLRYGLQDIGRELIGKSRKEGLRNSEFWAVKDVSFELKRGDCLGLIGHNGAGKSTLLKILNGLIKPDQGRIEIKGKVAALIELGAGFNPILTGRENIYNNASVLGFTKNETDEKLDSIIEFSELEDFIDAPVQSYSSGMKVRLGFAVAAQMEPDVLIIDEVLAVGDIAFRTKCLNRVAELLRNSAVIFVSHSMPLVSRICTKAMLLEKGEDIQRDFNSVGGVVEDYMKLGKGSEKNLVGEDVVSEMRFVKEDGTCYSEGEVPAFQYKDWITLRVVMNQSLVEDNYQVGIAFIDSNQQMVATVNSMSEDILMDKSTKVFEVKVKNLFTSANYSIRLSISIVNENKKLVKVLGVYDSILQFRSSDSLLTNYTPIHMEGSWDIVS
ncbi:MAG: lipopolysaccharide transport system ATP-binding protein [Parvicella sp.]|jgi:lipopolysaccharide transport system ATP-binding protein